MDSGGVSCTHSTELDIYHHIHTIITKYMCHILTAFDGDILMMGTVMKLLFGTSLTER